MNPIYIYDNRKKRLVCLRIESDNILRKDYFYGTFPEATGIMFHNNEHNCIVSIPRDEHGHFKFNWDSNVVYELIYRDGSRDRSTSPSSKKSTIWSWLTAIGSYLKTTNSTPHYKKTI
ncbi:unnamed protein product [Rotaria sordida]|uniref:Uncharacterized protein n=1 Tax=Rotaria sordida TaxID=392033 RepID=A0A814N555_9BILA|nr:unnamed protein product [Rotaria sordida]CAF1090363.1 unnamed protein product [Rotaria sordida]